MFLSIEKMATLMIQLLSTSVNHTTVLLVYKNNDGNQNTEDELCSDITIIIVIIINKADIPK